MDGYSLVDTKRLYICREECTFTTQRRSIPEMDKRDSFIEITCYSQVPLSWRDTTGAIHTNNSYR